jgi:mannan endo-1,4-beta-mannosidase
MIPQWDTDFEIGLVDDPSWPTLEAAAQAAYAADAAFDFTPWLLP